MLGETSKFINTVVLLMLQMSVTTKWLVICAKKSISEKQQAGPRKLYPQLPLGGG